VATVSAFARDLKHRVHEVTGGLTGSVGIGTSKLIAKIASDLDKPDGLVVVAPGNERDLLRPMQVTIIPGVGPATAESLRRIGVHTVADLEEISQDELVRVLGRSHGLGLHHLARAEDDRPVVPEREAKSISVEDTYDTDHVDRRLLQALVDRQAGKVTERLRKARLSGRTVTVKIRLHDFSTHTRSATLPGPTDDARTVARVARSLLGEVDTSGGVRLLGVGVSALADWIQDDLFADTDEAPEEVDEETETALASLSRQRVWAPGMDVVHEVHGRGWVWGAGRGVVTVRFETADTPPGRVLSLAADDAALRPLPVSPPLAE
jgi:DNA polymerase IV